ncbi:hypothetical protein HDV05_000635 [Chytridiales sp. JEL 0842]|nr:hypothetical protein HDV05_000635 [Chytridiales sp. JEL 0842]
MTRLRKLYYADSILKSQEKLETLKKRQEEEKKKEDRIKEDVIKFKLEQERMKNLSSFEEEEGVDAALGEAVESTPKSSKVEAKNDWTDYLQQRRSARKLHNIHHLSTQSAQRLNSLTYLLHASESFVTYSNLDQKLHEAFLDSALTSLSSTASTLEYPKLEERARAKLAMENGDSGLVPASGTGTMAFRQEMSKVVGTGGVGHMLTYSEMASKTASELHFDLQQLDSTSGAKLAPIPPSSEPAQTLHQLSSTRAQHLKDVLLGTIHGKPAPSMIQDQMQHIREKGGEETMMMERLEEVEAFRRKNEGVLAEKKVKESGEELDGFLGRMGQPTTSVEGKKGSDV